MTTGIENSRRVARRSIPVVLAAVAIGVFLAILIAQLQGVSYSAQARVYIPTSDLAASVTDVSQPYVDPQVRQDAEMVVARAPALYSRAASDANGALGTADELRDAVSADPSRGGVIDFTASAGRSSLAVARANAVADEFVSFRADLRAASIEQAIAETQRKIEEEGPTPDLRLLLSRLEVLQTLNAAGATVIARAREATKTNPRPIRDALIGLSIGLIVGLLVSGVLILFDTKVRSEDDVEGALEVPVIATLAPTPHRTPIVSTGKYAVRYADAYALLAANISQMDNGKKGPITVAITSSMESEGKTTTSANLAIALSNRGSNVALIDLDTRRADLSSILGIPYDSEGFREFAAGSASLSDVCWAIDLETPSNNGVRAHPARIESASGNARPTSRPARRARPTTSGVGSLLVIPAGHDGRSVPVSAAELRSLRTKLGTRVDVLVLDMPPALATPDMTEISHVADVVLVTARHGHATQRSLRQLARQVKSWGSTPVRAVLTAAPTTEYAPYGRR